MSWNVPIFIWGFPKMVPPNHSFEIGIFNCKPSSQLSSFGTLHCGLARLLHHLHMSEPCSWLFLACLLVRRWHLLGCRCQFGFTLHGTAFAPSVHLDRLCFWSPFSEELLLRPYTYRSSYWGTPAWLWNPHFFSSSLSNLRWGDPAGGPHEVSTCPLLGAFGEVAGAMGCELRVDLEAMGRSLEWS